MSTKEEIKFLPRLLCNESSIQTATQLLTQASGNNPDPNSATPASAPTLVGTKIKSKKVIFTIELPVNLAASVTKALVIPIPPDCYTQALAWRTKTNWGAILRIFGHSAPSASLSGMILQIKWKSSVGLIMLPAKGFEQFAGPIDVADTINIKEIINNHYKDEPRDKRAATTRRPKSSKKEAKGSASQSINNPPS